MTPAGAATLATDCAGPYVEATSETAEWTVPGEKTCFSTYFDDKTLWFVRAESDVLSDGVTLGLPACSRGKNVRVVERTLDSLLLDVRGAGWRSVCVSQANRSGDPVAVKLVARAFGAFETQEPNEGDPDPDPLVGECTRLLASKNQQQNEGDPDPDPLVSECARLLASKTQQQNEGDPDPDPLVSECTRLLASKTQQQNEGDPDPDPLVSECTCLLASRTQQQNEGDPDPDPLMGGCTYSLASKTQQHNEGDPDPDPLVSECGHLASKTQQQNEGDPDPDPFTASCHGRGPLSLTQQACALAGSWGRSQIQPCASRLPAQRWASAESGSMVRVDVGTWQRLEVEVDGESHVALLD
ncbi:MAG: hypothetical protein AAFX50_12915, partial [Acidobacteriota bacterium]